MSRRTDITYSTRELNHFFDDFKNQLNRIEIQTTKHNGRLTRMERIMLIFGTAVFILLITNGSQLVQIFKLII